MGLEAYHTCAHLERGLKVESTTLLFCTAYDPVWVNRAVSVKWNGSGSSPKPDACSGLCDRRDVPGGDSCSAANAEKFCISRGPTHSRLVS
jgi:hypothetical protein